jgi:hypothetical protein
MTMGCALGPIAVYAPLAMSSRAGCGRGFDSGTLHLLPWCFPVQHSVCCVCIYLTCLLGRALQAGSLQQSCLCSALFRPSSGFCGRGSRASVLPCPYPCCISAVCVRLWMHLCIHSVHECASTHKQSCLRGYEIRVQSFACVVNGLTLCRTPSFACDLSCGIAAQ